MRLLHIFNFIMSMLMNVPRERIPVGGQAVIEGVLMKGPQHWGLAIREPGGGIWRKSWTGSDWTKNGIWKYPVIRGFASMVEMMRVGMKALSTSTEISLGEEDSIGPLGMALTIITALAAVVGLFVALPMFVSELAVSRLGAGHVTKSVIEGIVRATVFIGYVAVIGLWKDIQQVFQYHGAEHKTINAWEGGADLLPDVVAKYSRIHCRCGTSFMLVVVFVSIIVFSCVGGGSVFWRIGSRVILLPIVIGLSYEFIKWASNSPTLGRLCIKPALSLQYLTTKEPDVRQIEVALAALDSALNFERCAAENAEGEEKDNSEADMAKINDKQTAQVV